MGLEWFGFCGSGGFMGIMGTMGVMGIMGIMGAMGTMGAMGVLGGRHCSCCYFRGFYVFDVFVFLLLEECLEAWDVAGAVGRGVWSWCAVGVEPYGVPSGIQCAADVCVGVVAYHKAVAGGAWYFGVEGGGALFSMLEDNRTIKCTKEIIIYNQDGYYYDLIKFITKLIREKFNDYSILNYIKIFNEKEDLIKYLEV